MGDGRPTGKSGTKLMRLVFKIPILAETITQPASYMEPSSVFTMTPLGEWRISFTTCNRKFDASISSMFSEYRRKASQVTTLGFKQNGKFHLV